jgi:hypothetical protein
VWSACFFVSAVCHQTSFLISTFFFFYDFSTDGTPNTVVSNQLWINCDEFGCSWTNRHDICPLLEIYRANRSCGNALNCICEVHVSKLGRLLAIKPDVFMYFLSQPNSIKDLTSVSVQILNHSTLFRLQIVLVAYSWSPGFESRPGRLSWLEFFDVLFSPSEQIAA